MTDAFRGLNNAGMKAWERTYFPLKGYLGFWDLSLKPTTNDRDKKLGLKDTVSGIALIKTESDTVRTKLITGLDKDLNNFISSRHPLEPDNFVLRLHTKLGHGKDNVWALRLIAEHENKSSQMKHRSTEWINQCPDQCWAFSQDAFWVKKLTAPIFDVEEMFLDGGGYLKSLYSKDVATEASRAALMLNISKRGFYVTDGKCASQGWHVFSMRCKPSHGSPGSPHGGGAFVRQFDLQFGEWGGWFVDHGTGDFRIGDVDTTVEEPTKPGDCCDVIKDQLALRGDVNFHMTDDLCHIAMGPGFPTSGCIATGWNWKGAPAPEPPAEELADDPSSNQEILPRSLEKGIRPLVLVPEPCGYPSVPTQPTQGSSGSTRPYGGFQLPRSSFRDGDPLGLYPPGSIFGETFQVDLPAAASAQDLFVVVNYQLSALLSGGDQMDFELHYKLLQSGVAVPTTWNMLSKSLTPADNPSSINNLSQLVWRIANVHRGDAKGGKLAVWFFRKSDTAAKTFIQIGEPATRFRSFGEPLLGTRGSEA